MIPKSRRAQEFAHTRLTQIFHNKTAMSNRFMYKIVALTFSSFQEVLLMDSDNIVLRDPASLFQSEPYRGNGSVLWMDFWRGSSAPDLQAVLGHATKLRHTHESGQMVLDKKKTWSALRLALFMNAHSEVFYPLTVNYMGLGDKEIVAAAFLHLGVPYGLAQHGPDHVGVRDHDRAETLGNTMMQVRRHGDRLRVPASGFPKSRHGLMPRMAYVTFTSTGTCYRKCCYASLTTTISAPESKTVTRCAHKSPSTRLGTDPFLFRKQHDMNGVPMFLHANLGKPMGFVPATKETYVRRWQISNQHGVDLSNVINDAAGVSDFEMWYYELIKKNRCAFDPRPPKHWYHTLGFGPFVEGFHVSDHYNVNDDLESFRGMKRAGIVFG